MSIGFIRRVMDNYHAAKEAEKDEEGLEHKDELNKLAKNVERELEFDLILARNARNQELAVLEQKEAFARNVMKKIEKFKKKAGKRRKRLEKGSEEESVVADEIDALDHIEQDSERIYKALKKRRQHDLEPLLAKATMVSKIINAEERMGAINPKVLKQFKIYEDSLLKRLGQENMKDIKQDEFKAIGRLRSDLRKETEILERRFAKKRSKMTQKRMNEALAQRLMLDNLLHLAAVDKTEEIEIKKASVRIYDALARIANLEAAEEKVMKK